MVLACCGEWLKWRLFMRFRPAIVDAYVRSTLECGGSTPPWSFSSALRQSGVEPPHSKVLRTAIFTRPAVSDTAAKDLGQSTGYVTKNVETPAPGGATSTNTSDALHWKLQGVDYETEDFFSDYELLLLHRARVAFLPVSARGRSGGRPSAEPRQAGSRRPRSATRKSWPPAARWTPNARGFRRQELGRTPQFQSAMEATRCRRSR